MGYKYEHKKIIRFDLINNIEIKRKRIKNRLKSEESKKIP